MLVSALLTSLFAFEHINKLLMSAGWGFALNGPHDEGHANRFVSFGSRQMRCGVAELVLSWRFHVGFLRVSVSGRVLLMCVGEPEVLTGHRCAAQTAAGIGRLLRTSPLLHPAKAFTPERDFYAVIWRRLFLPALLRPVIVLKISIGCRPPIRVL